MILMYDLNKKFIFTHPPKCGGSSLEELFGFLNLRKKYPHINKIKHASLENHLEELKNKNIEVNDFFKLSIIRNPWERAVSFYNHNKHKEFEQWCVKQSRKELPVYIKDARNMTFKEYILKYGMHHFNSNTSTKPFMILNNKFTLDYVIRLENLKEDILKIKDKLQIDSKIDIPHRNNSDIFLNRKHYTEYYDTETKKFIERQFEWDIETFGYKF